MSKTTTLADIVSANGTLIVPTGTTAGRPSATAGSIRFNTDLNTLESANGSAWANVGSGAASSGGGVSWSTTVQNTNFIAVAGNGYAVNTQIANVIVTLPASPTVGNFISLVDYKGTFTGNNLILYPNGNKINGNTSNVYLSTNGQGISLVYIDSTQGWINYASAAAVGPYNVEALIIAGGGGGGQDVAGGGGAGGVYYVSSITVNPGNLLTATVGSGGAGTTSYSSVGSNGGNSSFAGYVAIGGGYAGGWGTSYKDGSPGGSGGGGGGGGGGGSAPTGNAGAGTPGQGYPGGAGGGGSSYDSYGLGGGGGGAGGAGAGSNTNPPNGGPGTNTYSAWATATSTGVGGYYAGGGGGNSNSANYPGAGGAGGGGNGAGPGGIYAQSGVSNTGGGGGGAGGPAPADYTGGNGGSGVVIIRYIGNRRGTGGTVVSANGYTYHTFTSTGTFTA